MQTNIFENRLPISLFRSTNAVWNELKLNAPWSVGYVSKLIESKSFDNKEDWEQFYYETGKARKEYLEKLPEKTTLDLENIDLSSYTKKQLSWDVKNLNFNYGRTKEDFLIKGKKLFDAMQRQNSPINLQQCVECVRFRVICETWNGIMVREHNVILALKKQFPQIEFSKTKGTFDHKFAIDYQLYFQEKLICGIQIKPTSYAKDTAYLRIAKYANRKKNALYSKEFGAVVFDVLAKKSGEISNIDVLTKIRDLLNG